MGIDVQLMLCQIADSSLLQSQLKRPCRTLCLRVGRCDVVGVAGVAIAGNLRIDGRSARLCVLVLLQHQDTGALSHDEPASARIKGRAGAFRVLAGGQRFAVCKASHTDLVDGCLRSACNNSIGISIADGTECLPDGVGGGRTGGDHRQIRTLRMKADSDIARSDVSNHHRNQKRRNVSWSALPKLAALFGDGVDAAAAGTDIDSQPLRLYIFVGTQPCILHRLDRRCHGILRKQVGLAHLRALHVLHRVKILHLCCYLHLLLAGIKSGQQTNPVLSCNQVVPKAAAVISYRRDDPHAGYCYSSHLRPPTYSIRRLHTAPVR